MQEYKEAAVDPIRVRAAHELPDNYSWNVATELAPADRRLLKKFQDEMYNALAQPYITQNKSRIWIRVDTRLVENISWCFAKAKLLNPDLAKRTQAFYVEDPHYPLTIVTPTDFEPKPPFSTKANWTSAIYHKTNWETIPKILSEQLIGPAWVSTLRVFHSNFPATDFLESLPNYPT